MKQKRKQTIVMSKFKVGEEIIHKGDKRIIKTIEKRNNMFVYTFIGNSLYWAYESDIFKTPHQELLDLGWELSKVDNRYIEYINEEGDYLIIDKIEKTYYNLSSYYRPFDINLELAKILVRYLEELECSK